MCYDLRGGEQEGLFDVETLLTRHDLNRATLARQMLLERQHLDAYTAVSRLLGLQAQVVNPPYIGLWTRLVDFQRAELIELIAARRVVRAAMMRSTLHLVTDEQFLRYRLTIQPALERALRSFFGPRATGLDGPALAAAARPFLEEAPRTTGEIKAHLLGLAPDYDADALAYAVRTHLPQVQTYPAGVWRSGAGAYTTGAVWFGAEPDAAPLAELFRAYLAAFGPASVMDFQSWSGLTGLKQPLEALRPGLVVYQDEEGKELFDLPGLPLPGANAPAPPRFIPPYDNLLLAHAGRDRVLDEAYRKAVFLSAGRVQATFLLDGFAAGTWDTAREGQTAVLTLTPFAPLAPAQRHALAVEGERLLRFVEDDAALYTVRFNDPA